MGRIFVSSLICTMDDKTVGKPQINPSPNLYGNGQMTTKSPDAPSSETRPWNTPTGINRLL